MIGYYPPHRKNESRREVISQRTFDLIDTLKKRRKHFIADISPIEYHIRRKRKENFTTMDLARKLPNIYKGKERKEKPRRAQQENSFQSLYSSNKETHILYANNVKRRKKKSKSKTEREKVRT